MFSEHFSLVSAYNHIEASHWHPCSPFPLGPSPWPVVQMQRALQTWPVGMYKSVLVSVACVRSSLPTCVSENSQRPNQEEFRGGGRKKWKCGWLWQNTERAAWLSPKALQKPRDMVVSPSLNPCLPSAWMSGDRFLFPVGEEEEEEEKLSFTNWS